MNENFNKLLKDKGLTSYKLSKLSGIPYTTINEIKNEKIDINKCAAETVLRLSVILKTDMPALLNPIHYVDGVKGIYKRIHYSYKQTSDGMKLILDINKKTVEMDAGAKYILPSSLDISKDCAEMLIDKYIRDQQITKIGEKNVLSINA